MIFKISPNFIIRIALLSFIFLLILQTVIAAEDYKPYLHKPSIGNIPKLQTFGEYTTELFQGVAAYTYAIDIPLGTNDLQPALSLNYNSQSALQRPGILGSGWGITENNIIRNINYSADDKSDDYFILSLADSKYRLFYYPSSSSFKPEINPNQLKVENSTNAGEEYWVVTTTDGTRYRFGYNNDSRLDSDMGRNYVVKWSLDLVEDTHNNEVYYSYLEDPSPGDVGAVYLSNITYNNDQLRVVSFLYESQTRPDIRTVLEQGNKLQENRRLSDIIVSYNDSLVRKYSLLYADLNLERSLTTLANISYVGSDNSSVLNTVNFGYYPDNKGWDNSSNKWVVPESLAFSSRDIAGDYGVRLVDVNNDGFVDIVKAKQGQANETWLNNKNDGWYLTSLFSMPENIVDTNNIDLGVRFADVNSDGLIDILKAKSGSNRTVYLNNGLGWYDASTIWVLPVDFLNDTDDLGVGLIDFNGDNKPDILTSKQSYPKQAYLNNGSGWSPIAGWEAPDYFIVNESKDNSLREIDFNNDGLVDFIQGGKPGNAWINNGSGWENYSQYAPNLEFTDYGDNRPDLGVRFMDINGDGLQDMLQNFYSNVSEAFLNQTCFDEINSTENCTYYTYNITYDTNAMINNGSGWTLSLGWNSPEWFTNEGYNIGRRIADVNGDGYVDIIVAYQNTTYENITHIRTTTSSFLLKTITNTYGGTTDLTYNQSTLSDNSNNLGFNLWIIGNTSLNNSVISPFEKISEYSYLYGDGMFDYANSEFRGFGSVNETLPDNSMRLHYFHQDPILKGKEFKTAAYDALGNLVREDINTFTYSPDNMVYLNETSSQVYDGGPAPFITNISYDYDFYGNVKQINNLGDVAILGDEKLEVFGYIYNTTSFVVNKPSNYTLFDSDNLTIIKQVYYSYDNQTIDISLGELTKTEVYNNLGINPTIQYVYDPYGNIITQIDPLGHITSYTYDSTGTFKIGEVNPLGHEIDYNYDFGTGNLLSETRDGLTKLYEYDTFGRITKEAISPDTLAFPTKNYTYLLDGVAPEIIKLETKNNDSSYSENLFIYDGFANVPQVKALFDDTTQIVKNYFYDNKYRISEEQNPYFDTYSSGLSTPLSTPITKYTYDTLDRVISLMKQDNTTISIIFNKTIVTQTDENNNTIDYVLDAYDRIVNALEHNINSSGGEEIYTTTYTYKPDDNLNNITDAKGSLFTFEYDSLGRKISYDDPDIEKWTYSYDLDGNLISQTDGRNITTLLTYDESNRLTSKISGNYTTNFYYDLQYNGTLSNISLDTPLFNTTYIKYLYDDRLRIVEEELFVPVKQGVDEWINVSVDYDSSDRILNMYLPNGTLSYEYNSMGKLSKIQGSLDSINYNAFGKISNKTYTNNLITELDYDSLGRTSELKTGNIQNLSYTYDNVGNVKQINDTINTKLYTMDYDSLNRLITTKIADYNIYEHEKFVYNYNEIGNMIGMTSDEKGINYTYNSLVHAPSIVTEFNRNLATIECNLIDPIQDINVTQYEFFNFTAQVCCKDNDCWGVQAYLDPEEEYTSSTETHCKEGICTKTIYSSTRFTYEDNQWKKIEEARSLKDVWTINIDEDPNFTAEVIDFNYTTIILNLLVSKEKVGKEIPLTIYNKFDKSKILMDKAGNPANKDNHLKFINEKDKQTVTIDLSDTTDNLITQEIKWGGNSTLIRVEETNNTNLGDTYIRDGVSYHNQNYGSDWGLYIQNSSTSNKKALIKFDISTIPRYAMIEDAELSLYFDGAGLPANRSYNVSSYSLYDTYNWSENTVTWDTGPNSTDYNPSFTDEEYILGGLGAQYLSWNVTSTVSAKATNISSFYLYAHYNNGGASSDDIRFYSKEYSNPSYRPYLNVTYLFKGYWIPTNSSETPFYTTVDDPYLLDLEQDQCQNITWEVNATGEKRDYIFYAYAEKISTGAYGESELINITIV